MTELKDKTVVITGAAGGIGAAMAAVFSGAGAKLALIDIRTDELESVAQRLSTDGHNACSIGGDVSDKTFVYRAIDQAVARFGAIDAVINNAAWARYEPISDVGEATFDRMISSGLKSIVWTTQAALPHLVKRRGTIINVCSSAATLGIPRSAVYSALKGAVDAMTRQMAVELGLQGIRVNAVSPGPTPTPMTAELLDEAAWELRRRRTPLQRVSRPEDVAKLAAFLVSDDADFINGQHVLADGGMSIAFL